MIQNSTTRMQRLQVRPSTGGRYIEVGNPETVGLDDDAYIARIEQHLESAPSWLFINVEPQPAMPTPTPEATDDNPLRAHQEKFWVCVKKAMRRSGLTEKQVKDYYYERYNVQSLADLSERDWAIIAAEAQAAVQDVDLLDEWKRRIEGGTTIRFEFDGIGYRHWDGSEWDILTKKGPVCIRKRDIIESGDGWVVMPGWYQRRVGR